MVLRQVDVCSEPVWRGLSALELASSRSCSESLQFEIMLRTGMVMWQVPSADLR